MQQEYIIKKVIVNGTFDLLHVGHVALLEYARSCGDQLLVCIDSDSRVKQLKGASRPINTQADRIKMLGALRCVDMVQVFDTEEQLIEQIKLYQPDVMVKGSDYNGKSIVGESLCKQVIYYDRTEHSTTKTIQDIIDR
jgi:D-beta-D-heptose 7-phosphate kinase/D-beta-D-heptose 1-phosphate adenosyltransferase